jgi:hypothetical protein
MAAVRESETVFALIVSSEENQNLNPELNPDIRFL